MDDIKKTSIVILTYNNLDYSRDCIQSIRQHTRDDAYEIIVVDNDSTDGTKNWLKNQKDIKLQLNQANEGFPKGCNTGIALADPGSDILLLNNDTVVTPRWLENLKKCLYSDRRIGAAGAVCNHNENLQWGGFAYESMDEMQKKADRNNVSDSTKWEEKNFLIGFCLLIKRKVLDEIGNLDENYSPGYVEDNDLSLRILAAGYKLMLCHDCFVHHVLGSGFRKNLDEFYPVLFRNRRYFHNKWGFETAAFDDIKYASLRILDEEDKQKPVNILEMGCGIGTTMLKIKYEYQNAQLFGVEPLESKAGIAVHAGKVSIKTPDVFPLDFEEGIFDYILAGNLPETAADPQGFLAGVKAYLKPGGCIIAEFKNAMHYSVIRNLLNGKWLYGGENKNRTLYTLDDIQSLFADCGYVHPYIFHWFSMPDETDREFIRKLTDAGNENNEFLYKTYLFSVRFMN